MKNKGNIKLNINILIILLFISVSAFCQVKLPRLISDGMVLQRAAQVKIWGWASPGEQIDNRQCRHCRRC